ncbi:hypothetical protein [endosymbiont GvMRE of Glomus versiforme]|uniref:hypothetical protein n=1 Tax=endosymbiont GvMRE of Glomus versiforme TaxID=2039283 RepID=UPI000ED6855F|nr:hypothetical protein [endosymbiont GvMRE of Glomus versiforme]RHZ36725.1 hypothetical protein GvMRE_I2g412 [endosymbiont GvMRE of Glomus versiforme]RHZ36740.1 hypothetical protein GvMRE_I2g563 [endosymbiont GvMRE of Glomus versiforme]RHZ37537.1 hypothetical protein GvMRE_I1g719 [endosymbiont GvMRE of Glomus versiforme]
MSNLRIECQICRDFWQIIGTKDHLKGRLLINPLGAICYLCAGKKTPPLITNLWEWNKQTQKWEQVKGEGK